MVLAQIVESNFDSLHVAFQLQDSIGELLNVVGCRDAESE